MFLVRMSEYFIEAAVIAAVDAYVYGDSPGSGPKETISAVWGTRRLDSDAEPGGILHLERCHTAISAGREEDSVHQSPEARTLAKNVMFRFNPTMLLLGDLHTHPYSDLKEVTKAKGWEFSQEDLSFFMQDDDLWQDDASTPVMVVVAICKIQRVRESELEVHLSTMRFNMGEVRVWFNVCVGWTDQQGKRRNTVQDDGAEAIIWPDAYSNMSGPEWRVIDSKFT